MGQELSTNWPQKKKSMSATFISHNVEFKVKRTKQQKQFKSYVIYKAKGIEYLRKI